MSARASAVLTRWPCDSFFAGRSFDRNFVGFFGEMRPSGSLYVNLDGRIGQEIDYDNARQGREFMEWVQENHARIAAEAEATSSVAKLKYIDHYLSNKFVFLRFNFHTGDAAGQNMVGRATFAACS